MLTKIIVGSFAQLIEISLWVLLLIAFIGGWVIKGFWMALFFLVIVFILEVMLFGGLLVLEDIRKSLKRIEKQKDL